MDKELTPENLIEMGKIWGEWYLSNLSPEDRLKGLKAEDRLKGLKPEDRLKGLSVKEIEAYLKRLKK